MMEEGSIEIEDTAIRDGLTRPSRQPPFSEDDLRDMTSLDAALGVRTLVDLAHFPNLRDLYLNWSCVDEYSIVGEVGHDLEWLEINCSTVSSLSFLCECPNVWAINLRFNHIEDLSPLLEHENLENMSVSIVGNPLSQESFYEVLPLLKERASVVDADEEEIWKVQRHMWEAGHRASYGDWRGTEMVVQSLACKIGQKVRFEISPEELERELSVEGADVEEIARKYWTPPYSREGYTDRGDAQQARAWIDEAKLADELADSLHRLVERLDGQVRFARERQRICDNVEGRMYGWRPMPEPEGGRPGLPDWLCQWRQALAFVERDGDEVALRFGDDESVIEALRGQPVVLRPMGSRARRALTDRFRAFAVAWVGADAQYALVIRLENPDDRRLYLIDSTRVYRWSFDPWETVAFEGPEHLIDALEGPADQQDIALNELGWEPPDLDIDIGQEYEMEAEQARERLEQGQLDEELRAALARLVGGFGDCLFHREDLRWLEYDEVEHQARFPQWYLRWRNTLSHPLAPGKSAEETRLKLRFRPGSWQESQNYSAKEWVLSPPGVHQDHLRHKLIDRYGVLPIGHETYKVLGIRLDGSDQVIYTFDPSLFDADTDFDPFEDPAFSGPAELVDAIVAVGASSTWVRRE